MSKKEKEYLLRNKCVVFHGSDGPRDRQFTFITDGQGSYKILRPGGTESTHKLKNVQSWVDGYIIDLAESLRVVEIIKEII